MRFAKHLTGLIGVMTAFTVLSAPPGDATDWKLSWSDEFEGAALDESKWTLGQEWGQGYGGTKICAYPAAYERDGKKIVEVADGKLIQRAYKLSTDGMPYTGSMIKTRDGGSKPAKFSFRYGYGEVRVRRLVKGPGFHFNCYTYAYDPNKNNTGGHTWPGEIDYAEGISAEGDKLHQIIHIPPNNTQDGKTIDGVNWSEWNVIGFRWRTDKKIEFYLNGRKTHTTSKSFEPDDLDQYFLCRIGIGGWGTQPNSSTEYPGVQEIDWIRYWEECGGCGSTTEVLKVLPLPDTQKRSSVTPRFFDLRGRPFATRNPAGTGVRVEAGRLPLLVVDERLR